MSHFRPAAALLLAVTATACHETGTLAEDQQPTKYQFVEADEYVLVDTLGVALQSTALTNRDDAYNDSAPYGDRPTEAGILLTYRKYLAMMHMWVDDAGLLGDIDVWPGRDFTPCASEVGLNCDKDQDKCITAVAPCTLHEIAQDGNEPRSTLSVIFPDHITIDVYETPAFPNGRPLYRIDDSGELVYEQINDLVLAMGFLAMGEECSADPTGVCNVRTFSDMRNPDGTRGLNKQENDVPLKRTFPYLGDAHE